MNNTLTLYDLTTDYYKLQEMLSDGTIDEQVIKDTLESIDGAIEKKASSVVWVMKNLNAPIKAIDDEIERLKRKKESIKNNTDRLKDYIKYCMESAGIDEIKTDLITLRLQKNNPGVEVTSRDDVPKEYTHTNIEIFIDKNKALKDLKEGIDIAGLKLKEEKKHLRIY